MDKDLQKIVKWLYIKDFCKYENICSLAALGSQKFKKNVELIHVELSQVVFSFVGLSYVGLSYVG